MVSHLEQRAVPRDVAEVGDGVDAERVAVNGPGVQFNTIVFDLLFEFQTPKIGCRLVLLYNGMVIGLLM